MAKPWARYQVGFINTAKFDVLNANAICLWLQAKNYADEKLTDGLVPVMALKGFRFYSRKALDMLLASAGHKADGSADVYMPLFEPVTLGTVQYYRLHDYLEHNEPRDKVLERIAKADQKKADLARRQKEYRDRLRATEEAAKAARVDGVTRSVMPETHNAPHNVGPMSRDQQNQLSESSTQKEQERIYAREPEASEVLTAFGDAWQAKYGFAFSLILTAIEQMKLEQQIARLGPAKVRLAIPAYFATDDAYVLKNKHPLNTFLREPFKYLAVAQLGSKSPEQEWIELGKKGPSVRSI